FGYHLVVRAPRPDFRLALGTENPNVPRGGTTLVTASLTRLDGFDAAVGVAVSGLPPRRTAPGARGEAGEDTAVLSLSADASAPAFSPPTWQVVATAISNRMPGPSPCHSVDPGGAAGGWVTVTPDPNLKVEATPRRVVIRPGQEVSMT